MVKYIIYSYEEEEFFTAEKLDRNIMYAVSDGQAKVIRCKDGKEMISDDEWEEVKDWHK